MFNSPNFLALLVLLALSACNTRGPLDDVDAKNERSSNAALEPASLADLESLIERNDTLLSAFSASIGELSIQYGQITALQAQLEGLSSPDQWKDTVTQLQAAYAAREEAHAYMEKAEDAATVALEETLQAARTISFEESLGVQESLKRQEDKLVTCQTQREQLTNLINAADAEIEVELTTPSSPDFVYNSDNPQHFRTTCSGSYVTSLEGRNGLIVDQLLPVCNETKGTPVGGVQGSVSAPISCPADMIAKGLFVRQGDFVDGVALICASPATMDSGEEIRSEILGNSTGGTAVERYCPPYSAVIGLSGTTGTFNNSTAVMQVHPVCVRLP